MKLVRYLVAPVILALALTTAVLAGHAKAATVEFWMSPGATGTGLSQTDPAGTLEQVQSTIQANNPGAVDIQVRMAPGQYNETGTVAWQISHVEFLPWSYNGGGWPAVAAAGGYPVIDGNCSTTNYIIDIFGSHVTFTYIKLQNRLAGLIQPQPGTTGDYFYGDYFTRVGNAYCPGTTPGYGAVLPYGTTDWSIINSHFVDIVNSVTNSLGGPGQVHGIYAEHHATGGIVESNAFQDISGDPVRLRDGVNGTTISDNVFTHTGNRGYIGDWYATGESRSYSNVGSGNTWGGYYDTTPPELPNFCYDSGPSYACAANRMNITGS